MTPSSNRRVASPCVPPPICALATIYYGIRENLLLNHYAFNLLIFVWYIDAIFGTWDDDDSTEWIMFKEDLNIDDLSWEIEPLADSVNCLDMVVSI